jgi:hypothetical protein
MVCLFLLVIGVRMGTLLCRSVSNGFIQSKVANKTKKWLINLKVG